MTGCTETEINRQSCALKDSGMWGESMKITKSFKRNTPSTVCGESLTVTLTYYSFKKEEIDDLEEYLRKGIGTITACKIPEIKDDASN